MAIKTDRPPPWTVAAILNVCNGIAKKMLCSGSDAVVTIWHDREVTGDDNDGS